MRANRSKSRDNDRSKDDDDDKSEDDDDNDSALVPRRKFRKRRRSNSDPSSNRPRSDNARKRGGRGGDDDEGSGSEPEEVEQLPDRFDSQGRPVDRSSRPRNGWSERKGDFEYRNPKPGGAQARGAWSVGGTDPDQVGRLVRDVTELIGDGPPKGVGGWLGFAGRLLGSGMLGGGGMEGSEDGGDGDGDDGRRRGGKDVRRVGYGGVSSEISRDERGKGRRRADDHEYNDDVDYDDQDGGTRRRRRRRRRDAD